LSACMLFLSLLMPPHRDWFVPHLKRAMSKPFCWDFFCAQWCAHHLHDCAVTFAGSTMRAQPYEKLTGFDALIIGNDDGSDEARDLRAQGCQVSASVSVEYLAGIT